MSPSCGKCGTLYDPQEQSLFGTCPVCGHSDQETAIDVPRTGSDSNGSNLSVTGLHGTASATSSSSRTSLPKTEWVGKEFGDYKIVGRLGKGGMGMVFLAIQNSTNRKVALKVIRDDRLNDLDSTLAREWVARFKSEALAAARLEHEHIVTVYEVGQLDGNHFFSMQYVDGKSLSRISRERVLTCKEIASFMLPVCRALHHAHSRGILHRDIKPGNIMIDEQGRPFLTDFGLAKWFEDDNHSMTRAGQVVGTAAYMSPQQATDASHATIACDVYSLGATIYRLLAGKPPFDKGSLVEVLRKVIHDEPPPPSSINHAIDTDIETIALKCLEKDPEGRYPTADELADDLLRFINGEPILARPISKRERLWRWSKRNPIIATLSGLAILLLITVFVVSTVGYYNVRASLRVSLLAQAIGMHSSTNAGRRNDALHALREAAKIRPGQDLRNEYVRYLDQPDIELFKHIPIKGWDYGYAPYADAIEGTNRIIAVADGEKPIEIDAESGEIVDTYETIGPFKTKAGGASFLAKVSRNGTYLAGNSASGRGIEIWDRPKREIIGVLKKDGKPIQLECLLFDDTESSIFCAGPAQPRDGTIEIHQFKLPDLTRVSSWSVPGLTIRNLELLGNKHLFASIDTSFKFANKVWEITPGSSTKPNEISSMTVDQSQGLFGMPQIAYDKDFERVYMGGRNGILRACQLPSLEPISQAFLGRHTNAVTAIDASQDRRWIVSLGEDRRLKIWNKATGYVVTEIKTKTTRGFNVQWLPDGQRLIGDSDKGLNIWKFSPPISRYFLPKDVNGKYLISKRGLKIKFDSAEQSLFYLGDGHLSRLDLTNSADDMEQLKQQVTGNRMFISNDGDQYATFRYQSDDISIKIDSKSSATPRQTISKTANAHTVDLAQLDDGRIILTEFEHDHVLRVRQLESPKEGPEKELLRLKIQGKGIAQAVVAKTAQRIAVQVFDRNREIQELAVFDLNNGEKLWRWPVSMMVPFDISSNGDRLLFREGTLLTLVEVESNRKAFELPIGNTNRFAISGDGKLVVIMDETDGRIQLFNAKGELQMMIQQDEVSSDWMGISETGKWLAVCDSNGALRVWNLDQMRAELRKGGMLE